MYPVFLGWVPVSTKNLEVLVGDFKTWGFDYGLGCWEERNTGIVNEKCYQFFKQFRDCKVDGKTVPSFYLAASLEIAFWKGKSYARLLIQTSLIEDNYLSIKVDISSKNWQTFATNGIESFRHLISSLQRSSMTEMEPVQS